MRVTVTSFAASSTIYSTRQSPILKRHWSLYPFSFLHPAGRGLLASARIFRSMRVNSTSSSASNSFCAECLISREYLTTPAGAIQTGCAVLLVRNTPFLPPRFRHQNLPAVLPDGPPILQVEPKTKLAPRLIRGK